MKEFKETKGDWKIEEDEYDDMFDDYFNNGLDSDKYYYRGLFNYLLESLHITDTTNIYIFKIIE